MMARRGEFVGISAWKEFVAESKDEQSRSSPLEVVYVDLDGTLTTSDSLSESLVLLARTRPWMLLRLPAWSVRGKAHLKARVANLAMVDASALPYRQELIQDLRAWRADGVELVLATAAHHDIATQVAEHLKVFDSVLSSNDQENLRGQEKLAAIQRHADGRTYGYVGNGTTDIPILEAAEMVFITGPRSDRIRKRLPDGIATKIYPHRRPGYRDFLALMRARHWPKNLLLLIPLITSQNVLEATPARMALTAVLAFSLTASGTYVVNDVLDVHADRRHGEKKLRPVASGLISITTALVFATGLLAIGLVISVLLPVGFRLTLIGYVGLSLAYSLVVKRLLLLDIVTLGALFVLRIFAGAEAIEVTVSFWLFAFSLFFFSSLALTKRCSELHNLELAGEGVSHGRAYRVADLATLQTIGVSSGVISVLIVALYIEDPASAELYSRPDFLWLTGPLLLYWIGRTWIKVGRGEINEDPLMYSLRDRASWGVMLLAAGVVLAAG
ncbi:MAG: UbiA family prenyltransferase [Acidimicrobiia bacterium]